MKTLARFLLLFFTFFAASCSSQPTNIKAVSGHALDDFVISNEQGEVLGVVDDVIVNSDSGIITYVIVTLPTEPHGLTLAPVRNEEIIAIPWQVIRLDPEHKALIFQLDGEALVDAPRMEQGAPAFSADWDEVFTQYWQPFLEEK